MPLADARVLRKISKPKAADLDKALQEAKKPGLSLE